MIEYLQCRWVFALCLDDRSLLSNFQFPCLPVCLRMWLEWHLLAPCEHTSVDLFCLLARCHRRRPNEDFLACYYLFICLVQYIHVKYLVHVCFILSFCQSAPVSSFAANDSSLKRPVIYWRGCKTLTYLLTYTRDVHRQVSASYDVHSWRLKCIIWTHHSCLCISCCLIRRVHCCCCVLFRCEDDKWTTERSEIQPAEIFS